MTVLVGLHFSINAVEEMFLKCIRIQVRTIKTSTDSYHICNVCLTKNITKSAKSEVTSFS